MEMVLRSGKDELCIDAQEGYVDFCVLLKDRQLDFSMEISEWKLMKKFIDDSIYEYENQNHET